MSTATVFAVGIKEAHAGFTLGFELRQFYEDNVIGLINDNPNSVSNATNAAAENVGTGGPIDTKGGGSGSGSGGGGAPVLKRGGDDLNNIPQPVSQGTGTAVTTTGSGAPIRTAADFSTYISVDGGILQNVGDITTLLLRASVDHTSYNRYTQFDFTRATLSAGVAVDLTDNLTAKALLRDSVKRFKNSDRNANALGASFSLRERFTPSFWMKGVYSFEQNNADSIFHTYTGNSYSIWAGYYLTKKTSAGLGYSYLTRDFKSSQFRLITNTISADLTWDFLKYWSVNVGYDRELGDSNVPDSATVDNIYSVGLLFYY